MSVRERVPSSGPRVVFVQKFVPHYRLPFFEGLRDALARDGTELVLVYGDPDPYEGSKVRTVSPEWGHRVDSRIVRFAGRYLYRQGALRHVRRGDLVVVEHAAKLVDNYLLYALSRVGYLRLGYFGHGENFQRSDELGLSRALKRAMLVKVSRWFAYTEVSRASLLRQGVDEARITTVNNTLVAPAAAVAPVARVPERCLYIGGLYAHKRLDFLVEACARIAARRPGFELHVVGDGPERAALEAAARRHGWLTYHGALYGEPRAALLRSAQAILMPGLVGLVTVDAFHFGAPLVTSDGGEHSPEIAYVADGVNALVDDDRGGAEGYAATVERLFDEPGLMTRLRAGCEDAARTYSMDNMVARFAAGVRESLGTATPGAGPTDADGR